VYWLFGRWIVCTTCKILRERLETVWTVYTALSLQRRIEEKRRDYRVHWKIDSKHDGHYYAVALITRLNCRNVRPTASYIVGQ